MSSQLEVGEVVDVEFPVFGQTLPSDHAYALYSAISRLVPAVHQADWLGVHTLKGRRLGDGTIKLPRCTFLRLRIPFNKIIELYPLAGSSLSIGPHEIRCGLPRIRKLRPSDKLWCRMVVVKLADKSSNNSSPEAFLAAIQKQVRALDINAEVEIERLPETFAFARRVVRVKGATIAGYGVYLKGLSDKDSLKVQISGLGGRRRIGCGLFSPVN
jgi:CRISPR-associated protein Cas6